MKIIFSLLLWGCLPAIAQAVSVDGRNAAIQQEMDCVDQHLHQSGDVTWSDVCDVPESPYQKHMQVVDQQMDAVQIGASEPPDSHEPPSTSSSGEKTWAIGENIKKPVSFSSRTHSFDLYSETFYYNYREPGLDKYTGVLQGWGGRYTYRPSEGDFLNNKVFDVYTLEGLYASGKHTYDGGGQLRDGTTIPAVIKGVPASMYEVRGLLGRDYFTSEDSRITPYIGFGVRQKADKSGGRYATFGPDTIWGYDRTATYFYLPGGFTVTTQNKNYQFSLNFEGDYFLKGFVNTQNSDLNAVNNYDNSNITFVQHNGYGLRSSVKLLRRFLGFDLYCEPFIRYWNVGQSKVVWASEQGSVGPYIEPSNYTVEFGSKFGIDF